MPIGYTWTLGTAQGDGTALTNSTTATSLLAGQAKYVFPPQFFDTPGKDLRVRALGRISTVVTTPGTLTFDLRFVSSAGTVIVATGPAFALNIVAKTNVSWDLEWNLTLRSVGSGTAATFMHQGIWTSEAVIGSPLPSAGGSGSLLIPASAPAVGTGWDSTLAQQLDLFATWSVANASNSIQTHQLKIISGN